MDKSINDAFDSLEWKRCKQVPVNLSDAQAVTLGDRLYIHGGEAVFPDTYSNSAKLYIYVPSTNLWTILDTLVCYFALAAYRTQLVLIGGVMNEYDEHQWRSCTNRIWTLTEHNQLMESLPPMNTKRQFASAVSHGDYLLVAGGEDEESDMDMLDVVEVFNGYYWAYAQPLPMKPFPDMKSAILDGYWYLVGGSEQEKGIYCVSLNSLIASCESTQLLPICRKRLPDGPNFLSCLTVYDNQLIALQQWGVPSSMIYAYSFKKCSWIHVGDLPVAMNCMCTATLSTGDLIIIGGMDDECEVNVVFKAFSKRCMHEANAVDCLKQDLVDKDSTIKDLEEKIKDLEAKNSQLRSQISLATNAIWCLRGVEVCGEMTVVVYSSHYQQVTWPGYGLRLHIPKGCLPAGMEQCTINIKASLAGQYKFPENSHLVSAIIWLQCEDVHKFTTPIIVELQHCAKLENVSNLNLNFVRAVCSQKQLPYTFKQLSGGNFTSHSSYGVIELNSFSGVGVVQKGSDKRQYYSKIFFLNNYFGGHRIDLIITWDTEAHLNVVKRHYKEERALPGPDQPVDFEGEEIRLDFPMEETKINDKWTIAMVLQVTKEEVDSYLPGKRIPHCELAAHSIGEPVTRLVHRVILLGAKPPRNMFTLSYMPPSASSVDSPQDSCEPAKPKLKDLLKELYSTVTHEWENISILLDIQEGQLRQINADKNGDSKACLREMLRVWLSHVAPPPSWSAMADALDTLGHEDIATHLRTIYMY